MQIYHLQKPAWETVEYTDNPDLPALEDIEIVSDFLLSPEELVFREAATEKAIKESDPDLLPEYDFSHGIRGKYVKWLASGNKIIILAPDVAEPSVRKKPDSHCEGDSGST